MKVKVLAANIMVDYKKIEKGSVIELADTIAARFAKAGLVEAGEKKEGLEPLLVKVGEKDIDLNKLSIKDLIAFSENHQLGITQTDGELKADLAKRIFEAYNHKE